MRSDTDLISSEQGASPHVAFGMGLQLCAGPGPARQEGQADSGALADSVERCVILDSHRYLKDAVRRSGKLRVKLC